MSQRERYAPAAGLAAIYVLMIVAVNPLGDFPLNDDWAYADTVKLLLERHQLRISSWGAPSVLTQALFGALFCLPFGFSYTALRLASATLGLVAVLATFWLARRAGAGRGLAFVCGLTLAVNPLLFQCAHTFMTDTPFVAWLLLAIGCFVASAGGSRALVAAAVVMPLVATLTRQLGLVLPLAFAVGCVLGRTVTRRSLAVLGAGALLATLGLRLFEHWLRASGQMTSTFGLQTRQVMALLGSTAELRRSWPFMLTRLRHAFVFSGLFLLPALIAILPRRLRARRRDLAIAAALAITFAATTVADFTRRRIPLPFNGHYNLVDFGLGPTTLTDVYVRGLRQLPQLDAGLWWLLTWIGVAGGSALVFLLALTGLQLCRRHDDGGAQTTAATAWAFAGGYLVILSAVTIVDRYFIPLFPLLLVAGVWNGRAPGIPPWLCRTIHGIAIAAAALLCWFSVAATHDYLAWNRARWQALYQLTDLEHVPPTQIDGGFEFNGSRLFGGRRNVPGKAWWWVEDDLYMVTLGPMPGYHTLRTYPYWRWLPPGRGRHDVVVLVRDP